MWTESDRSDSHAGQAVELRMATGPWPAGTRGKVVEANPTGWVVVELEDSAGGGTGIRLDLPADAVSPRDGEDEGTPL
jgi:hypothetical protein